VLVGAVATSGVGWAWQRRTRRVAITATVSVLLVAHAGASLAGRPDYLAYFNALGGPVEQRHRLLVDSNLDWGQGLPALADWLRQHPQLRPIYLSYFGSDDPAFYTELAQVVRWGDLPFSRKPRNLPTPLGPGLYIFGATQFERVYSYVRGPWTQERERLYQDLNTGLFSQNRSGPATTRSGRVLSNEELNLAREDFDALKLGRVTNHLQGQPPLAVLGGGALLIYAIEGAQYEQVIK